MEENRKVTLPSGSELTVQIATFADSKQLFHMLLEEVRTVPMDPSVELDSNFYKDLVCIGMSSKKIEAALQKCFTRCLYNGVRIDHTTFESVEARGDYLTVCLEVAEDNIHPFMKNLSAELSRILALLSSIRKSK